MLRRTLLTGLVATAFVPFLAQAQMKYSAGNDYTVLDTPIEAVTDKPKVIEFFWFACPHCNALRPSVEKWLKEGKAENVEFEYVPATFDSQQWALPAQAYYTMQALNKEADLYDAYFEEIFTQRNRGMIASIPEIKKFFVKNGVSPEDFDKAWDSFDVKQKLKRAEELFAQSGLDGVPAFIVNGKYVVQPKGDNQAAYDRTFDIINTLAK